MTNAKKFEWVWYAHGFLRELVLIYPTYAIMMQQGGISAIELSTLFIIWSFALFVFEVPSGILADRISRRNLLVISGMIKGSTFLIWWLVPGFAGSKLTGRRSNSNAFTDGASPPTVSAWQWPC
ncbi:MAG: hypothetical protein E2O59_03085 [Gammaproteobacteria bacterium]|nr:MAG: hypothetical protein E2O59_03085 [Gammaproteobacteria bacterium]